MDKTAIADCMRLSFADTPFPEVVRRLAAVGVRAYRTDLIALRNTYYDAESDRYDSALPLADAAPVGASFDAAEVAASVRAIQVGAIGYAEFLHRIRQAGCASYDVFIGGRKVVYYGRDGDFHTEMFPGAQS